MSIKNFIRDPRVIAYNSDEESYGMCLSCGNSVPYNELSKISTCIKCEDTPMFI